MTKCGYEFGVESNYIDYLHNLIYTPKIYLHLFVYVCVKLILLPYKNIYCVQLFCSGEAHGLGLNFDQACVAKGFIKHKDLR
jgi:hypothetical protein